MNELLRLDERIQGIGHVRCEDFAKTELLEEPEALLFAVADGHGDPACARSAEGSEFAVEAAFTALKRLAEVICQPANEDEEAWLRELEERAEQAGVLKRIAEWLPQRWSDMAMEHLRANPLTEAEQAAITPRRQSWVEERPTRLYGSTIIAGVLTKNLLVLLRQGDGSCVAVYADGTVRNALAEDERCVGNVTTSLCDVNVVSEIRFAVIDRRVIDPVACFVATDGVDKSLAGEAGVADFFAEVVLGAVRNEDEMDTRSELVASMSQLRDSGAGDDTSVAGYVDIARAKEAADALANRRQSFARDLELQEIEARLVSTERIANRGSDLEAELARIRPVMEERQQLQQRREQLLQGLGNEHTFSGAVSPDEQPTQVLSQPTTAASLAVDDELDDAGITRTMQMPRPQQMPLSASAPETEPQQTRVDFGGSSQLSAVDANKAADRRGKRHLGVLIGIVVVLAIVAVALLLLLLVPKSQGLKQEEDQSAVLVSNTEADESEPVADAANTDGEPSKQDDEPVESSDQEAEMREAVERFLEEKKDSVLEELQQHNDASGLESGIVYELARVCFESVTVKAVENIDVHGNRALVDAVCTSDLKQRIEDEVTTNTYVGRLMRDALHYIAADPKPTTLPVMLKRSEGYDATWEVYDGDDLVERLAAAVVDQTSFDRLTQKAAEDANASEQGFAAVEDEDDASDAEPSDADANDNDGNDTLPSNTTEGTQDDRAISSPEGTVVSKPTSGSYGSN